MNQLIKEYAVLAPFNPVEYVWIDFASGHIPTDEEARAFGDKLRALPYNEFNTQVDEWPLPFEKTVLLLPVLSNEYPGRQAVMVVTLERSAGELKFRLWANADGVQDCITITVTGALKYNKEVRVRPRYAQAMQKSIEECATAGYRFMLIALRRSIGLAVLGDKEAVVAKASGNTFINAKRIKKGKRPFFEWTTIEVKPSAPAEPKGGTHASPKPHMRRGHVRRLKSGKIVTIKSMFVNKHKIPDEGFVFHDYRA